jgi:RIO-like serine/threonine protein kinase
MKHGNNRILGDYGVKAWDDNGFACVIKSAVKNHLDKVTDNELSILQNIVSEDYFNVLKYIDCHYPVSKNTLLEKTGLPEARLNEILIYLTENEIIEYFNSHISTKKGYKLFAKKGIIAYSVLALAYLLTQTRQSLSEYLPC